MAFKLQVTRHVEKKEVSPAKIKLEVVHHNPKPIIKKVAARKPRQKKTEVLKEIVNKEVKGVLPVDESLPIKKKRAPRVKKENLKVSE